MAVENVDGALLALRWLQRKDLSVQLDPELAAVLPFLPPQDFKDLKRCRALSGEVTQAFARASAPELKFDDDVIQRPDGSTLDVMVISNPATSASAPVVLHIHGGGFALGSPSFDEAENAEIVGRTGVTIVSPNYRLAPEHPFPAAFDDCCTTLEWIASTDFSWADPGRPLAVMGHSAGGGLAAAVALWCRDFSGIPLAAQILLEPELDPRLKTRSMNEMMDTPIWYHSNAELSWDFYLAGQEPNQFAAPALAATLEGLPRTYLSVNQVDPLRDEGLEYARRLMSDGVLTELHCWAGAYHGFMAIQSAQLTHRAMDQLVTVIRTYLAPRVPPGARPKE